jgi:uncharacterized protein YjbI with pentapeptide repeats
MALSSAPPTAAEKAGRPRYTQAQINQFVAAHERFYRGEPRGHRAIMRFLQAPDIDFSDRMLAEVDLSGANLKGANFANANLERASFYCADLSRADASGANLHRADLRGCSLRDANLAGARLDEADMREAVLMRADVDRGFQLVGRSGTLTVEGDGERAFAVDFTNCSMKEAQLQKAKLKGARFEGAMLNGANLSGAVLDGATFHGAVLTGADLAHARIDPGALKNCVLDPSREAVARADELVARLAAGTKWILSNGKEGHPVVLDGEDLRPLGDVFEKRQLAAMSARDVCAVGVSFRGAQLQGAKFDGADLRDADFTGADLRGASFQNAKLWHARFDGTDLRPLHLAQGLREVDFSGAAYTPAAFAASLQE